MKPYYQIRKQDWQCPYCKKIAFNGENKLRHLSKHEPVIARMLRDNFLLGIEAMLYRQEVMEF